MQVFSGVHRMDFVGGSIKLVSCLGHVPSALRSMGADGGRTGVPFGISYAGIIRLIYFRLLLPRSSS